MPSQIPDLLHAARSEDLTYEEIESLAVLSCSEREIVDKLKVAGAHLVEGARGVGKSMLLRCAEREMDKAFKKAKQIAVYVNFKTSTILEGVKAGERDGFQLWVNTRILQALHEKLLELDLIGRGGNRDPYQRLFRISSVDTTKSYLQEKIHLLQKLAFAHDKSEVLNELGSEFLDRVRDTGLLTEAIRQVIEQFELEKMIFLFDEAAHTFIPQQQEIFFEIFKLLHGGRIAVKAAVYPTVTSYGRNFEVGQDAIVLRLDRFEPGELGRAARREQFRDIVTRRIPERSPLRKKVFARGELLDLCIELSSGNPRAFLHLLNRVLEDGFSERSVTLATQEYVDHELLPYHQNLAKRLPTFAPHVRIGLELLRQYVIPEIRSKNHRETKSGYQSAFFTVQRDISPNLKLALDILCYSGVLVNKGTVKIANRETGRRYMINLALLAAEKAFGNPKLTEAVKALSLTDYREFSASDPQIETYLSALRDAADECPECSANLDHNAKFCSECGTPLQRKSIISGLLDESVDALSISGRLKDRVRSRFPKVGDVVQATREEVMQLKYIKEVRSRMIKNAADEFISG